MIQILLKISLMMTHFTNTILHIIQYIHICIYYTNNIIAVKMCSPILFKQTTIIGKPINILKVH